MQQHAHRSCSNARLAAATFILAASCITSSLFAQGVNGKATATIQSRMTMSAPKGETTILPDGRLIYNVTEKMPEYSGDLQAFLSANLRYPEDARKSKIEGRSVVKFIVTSDGKVSDAEIIRSSGNRLLDEESLRVVSLMQDWKPGTKDSYPVSVFFYLPIVYKLD